MRRLIILICLLILYSCGDKTHKNTFNINDLGLTYKELTVKGYSPLKGNISVYHKVEKDTTVYIGFNRKGKSRAKEWVINLDYNSVGDFLNKKQIFNITSDNFLKEDKGYSFISIGQLDNQIYVCKVLKGDEDDNATLSIITTKSYSNEQIEENIKYYDGLYKKGLSLEDMSPDIEDEG